MKSISVTISWENEVPAINADDVEYILNDFFCAGERTDYIAKPHKSSSFPLMPIITDNPTITTTVDFKNIH